MGDSAYIPNFEKLLKDVLNGQELDAINPEEAVIYGRAAQAASLLADKSETVQDLLLLDVTSFSLGIETARRT